jgi:hypothetical protein
MLLLLWEYTIVLPQKKIICDSITLIQNSRLFSNTFLSFNKCPQTNEENWYVSWLQHWKSNPKLSFIFPPVEALCKLWNAHRMKGIHSFLLIRAPEALLLIGVRLWVLATQANFLELRTSQILPIITYTPRLSKKLIVKGKWQSWKGGSTMF